jgi:hypothetical protein
MKKTALIGSLLLCLVACKPAPTSDEKAASSAPTPQSTETTNTVTPAPASASASAPVDAATGNAGDSTWTLPDGISAIATKDGGLELTCEEAKKTLRISFSPAWEKDGPFDNAKIHIGDKSFALKIDETAQKEPSDRFRPVYVLPADADSVTAIMMATNMRLTMTNQDGEQERQGTPTDDGSFDMFGTTCAQINGLR